MRLKRHRFHTVIIGAGAAGMNAAVHLCEMMARKGVRSAGRRIVVLTRGLGLGASRMSGSDKQTYYKMGTSPLTADSAASFARSLTAAGCCHEDLALVEGTESLREFYHLVRAGVPFPQDALGSFIGYKTDHDPFERATSAGPKTSQWMSRCLQAEAERYGVAIHDRQEVATLLTTGRGAGKRIVGVLTLDMAASTRRQVRANVYYCQNLVLAAGGPGEMYRDTVYPPGQFGLHGPALEAGLAAENLTESQFGLASTKFRWNVSGTYMQVIPRIYSTDAAGRDPRDFLADAFPTMRQMAGAIFLKGYQWPFDPQRIADYQSSLVDVLVFSETRRGRRVWMDFRGNPVGRADMQAFDLGDLPDEASDYLHRCAALQARPIDRLRHMNPLAIEVYAENGIDLAREPLEIALCAQHNNGGLAVNTWWESGLRHTFVIGEMAGTHGVKRPGGAALNSGQVGGLRCATYIANAYLEDTMDFGRAQARTEGQLGRAIERLFGRSNPRARRSPREVLEEIRDRMTAAGGHLREIGAVTAALRDAIALAREVRKNGLARAGKEPEELAASLAARHMALTGAAYLKAIKELLRAGAGSRGSYLVVGREGAEVHPSALDERTGKPMRIKPENESLRRTILRLQYDPKAAELFSVRAVAPRTAPADRKSFETAWTEYRAGEIYTHR